jgi:hypothetical protein
MTIVDGSVRGEMKIVVLVVAMILAVRIILNDQIEVVLINVVTNVMDFPENHHNLPLRHTLPLIVVVHHHNNENPTVTTITTTTKRMIPILLTKLI